MRAALLIFLLLTYSVSARCEEKTDTLSLDSVQISLLTCDPIQKVYGLYGHTAIRVENRSQGVDLAVNYGVFSFDKPFFILRFTFGLTDYEMGIEPFQAFCEKYAYYICGVRQQVLNLTTTEKQNILRAIEENYLPENRVYRYNYFYDNCTTRARDMIVSHLEGRVVYAGQSKTATPSYRKLTHAYNEQHPWARMGNDLLLGIGADFETNATQAQFLPDNLRKDFDQAVIVDQKGVSRPMVEKSFWVLPKIAQPVESEFPLSPTQCALLLAAIVVISTLWEYRKRTNYWLLDVVLLLADGACGLILLAMVFSEHPTVKVNLQILMLNPLSLLFLYSVVRKLRKGQLHAWLKVFPMFLIVGLICGFFQTFAEGITIVALSLLFRYTVKNVQMRQNTPKNIKK